MWTKLVIAAFLLLASAGAWAQTCDVTVSTCAAAQSAANSNLGTAKTICLNTGNYGTCDFFNMSRTVDATIKSTTGVGAVGSWRIGNSDHLRFESVTGGFLINSCSTWITLKDTVGQPNSSNGIEISQEACPTTVQNITVDGAILDRIGQQTGEGRLSIRDGNTITIKNSQFLGVWATAGGPSDGIQMRGAIRNITIGPGNLFSGIDQNICNANGGAHCDTIQTYGGPCTNVVIEGNILRDSSTTMLNESSCDGAFRNNILINLGDAQFHTWNPIIWEHNTLYNSGFRINGAAGDPSAGEIRSNIFHNSSYDTTGSTPCTACVASYNLFTSGCTGSNCITGTPTYVGGAPPPSTWAGWELAPGSAGSNNAHDGQDRGTLYYGVAQAPDTEAPTTPTNPTATDVSSTQINLAWTSSTDNVAVAGYNIRRCSGAGCPPTTIIGTSSVNSYSSTGLTPSTLYRYTIQAYDTATPTPNTSGQTAIVQATTSAPGVVTVTPSIVLGASHGSISPSTPQSITEGTTTTFTVTPASGYKAIMSGTCGGNLAGTTYTTNVIAASCTVQTSFIPTSCVLDPSNGTATNVAMTAQSGTFTYLFSVIPAAANHDLTLGHTTGNWTAYTSYSTTVRFADNGVVDVRNGNVGYGADVVYPYSAGVQYNVRIVANVATDTYNVYIAADGQAETQIASNYAFRTAAASLNNFAYVGLSGAATGAYACPIGLSGGDTTAPTVQARRVVASGNSFELDLDEPAGSVSGSAGLTLSASGGAVTLAGCSTASDIITCSTSRQILGAETVTASYSGSGGIADTTGNPLASFSNQAVTNNSTQALVALSLLTPPDGTRYRKEVSSTTIGLTTSKAASCRRASSPGVVWSSMTPYTTTGATSHSSSFSMHAGASYRVCSRCLDTAAQQYSANSCTHFSVRSARKR